MTDDMSTCRIYLAGPMTGMPEHNYPAFHEAAQRLREREKTEVINPADNFKGRTDLPRETYLRADVALLVQCDAIAMLPGWEKSRGAKMEYLIARSLSMPVFNAITGAEMAGQPVPDVHLHQLQIAKRVREPSPESILDEAARITAEDRQDDYGHPSQDFTRTAMIWTAILSPKLMGTITAADVPLCMIAVKLARQAHRHKRDNLVDIAGYARTAAMVAGDE